MLETLAIIWLAFQVAGAAIGALVFVGVLGYIAYSVHNERSRRKKWKEEAQVERNATAKATADKEGA